MNTQVRNLSIIVMIIILILLMVVDVSLLYNSTTAFLFHSNVMSVAHILLFVIVTAYTKNVKMMILLAFGLEFSQILVESRAFEIIDILSNVVGVYVAEQLFIKTKK